MAHNLLRIHHYTYQNMIKSDTYTAKVTNKQWWWPHSQAMGKGKVAWEWGYKAVTFNTASDHASLGAVWISCQVRAVVHLMASAFFLREMQDRWLHDYKRLKHNKHVQCVKNPNVYTYMNMQLKKTCARDTLEFGRDFVLWCADQLY